MKYIQLLIFLSFILGCNSSFDDDMYDQFNDYNQIDTSACKKNINLIVDNTYSSEEQQFIINAANKWSSFIEFDYCYNTSFVNPDEYSIFSHWDSEDAIIMKNENPPGNSFGFASMGKPYFILIWNKKIINFNKNLFSLIVAHEIGHTLGLPHIKKEGLMDELNTTTFTCNDMNIYNLVHNTNHLCRID